LANNAYADLFDTTREALMTKNFKESSLWNTTSLLEKCMTALADRKPQQIGIHVTTSSGKTLWLECRILPTCIKGEDHVLIQFIDLTERKRIEEELRYGAFHDSLTRLPNRRLLLDRLDQALHSSKRNKSHLAVLFLDLNKFKQLNDTHGHDVGDQMLIEVSNRLKKAVREEDTVARLGGDEFVVLLEGLDSDSEQAKVQTDGIADKIRKTLSEEYILGNVRHQSSVSIGIKLFLGDQGNADLILKEADEAMYQAKKAGATR